MIIPSDEPTHEVWTQGLTSDLESNGKFEATDFDDMPLSKALHILRTMPPAPAGTDSGDYCPPQIGFGSTAISHIEQGKYLVWPENRTYTLQEAEKLVLRFYGKE